MNPSLQQSWQQQLNVAEATSSWRTSFQIRVLRFLLSRYASSDKEAPTPKFPLYEGGMVHGRAKALLSEKEQGQRLEHIKAENQKQTQGWELIANDVFEWISFQDIRRRRKLEAFRQFGQTPPPSPFVQLAPEWLQYDIGKPVSKILDRILLPHYFDIFTKVGLFIKFLVRVLRLAI